LLAVLAFVALAVVGCSTPHLAGTNDAALEYVVEPDPSTGETLDGPLAAAGVKARLASAQVMAEVDALETGRVRVVVDADIAGAVDDLLIWRGGLHAMRVDGEYVLAPSESATAGLRPMSAAGPEGEERWLQGPGDAVGRAVRESKLDAAHAVFAERLPAGNEWRTRVAALPPLVDLGVGAASILTISPILRGRELALGLSPEAQAPLVAFRAEHPGGRVALARGRVLVATLPAEQAAASPLVIPFGEDLLSYTRAYHAKLLLRSPILPRLRRVSAAALPERWGLAVACAVLPFILSFAWLFFVRRFDRARPEPLWLVVATFALGGLAIVPAALIELGLASLSPWLDPSVVTLGGQAWALPLSIPVFTLCVGLVEEGAKLVAAWSLARHRKEFDEPVDGIVYGCAAALGFAAVENVKYFALGRMSGAVIAMRAFETVPAHLFFGAIWGYAMGQKLVSRRARVWPWLLLAALVHGTFDAVVSTDGLQLLATLIVLGLAVSFVAMLRSALRHGAVRVRGRFDDAPATEPFPLSEMPRTFIRVGSPAAFWSCAVGMVTSAFTLTIIGVAFELLHHRVGAVFVVMATVMLAAFGLAAYGASATLPLDVAIDAQGITFAGGLTRWGAMTGAVLEPRGRRVGVRVDTAEGPVRIGPATPETAKAILAAIAASRT
jgi:RsiW-degrading membrane proteinase PrsW (M82 family)